MSNKVVKGTGRDGSVAYLGAAGDLVFVMVETERAAIRGHNMTWYRDEAEQKWPGLTWVIVVVEPRIQKYTGDCQSGPFREPLPARGRRVIRKPEEEQ